MDKPLKNTFGLDISNTAITAVELGLSKKGLRVINFARIELEPGIVEDNCIIVDKEAFKEAVKRLLQEGYAGPFMSRNVVVSIPEEKTFAHRLCLPNERLEDEEYIKELASDFIPIELGEACTDYRFLEKCDGKKDVNINFVAAQKNIVLSIIDVLQDIGLKAVFVDIDKNSLVRACENYFQNSGGDYLVVDAGEDMTTFCVNSHSGLSYTLDSEIAGKQFVENIKEGLQTQTVSEVKKLLADFAKDPGAQEKAEYKTIENLLKDKFKKLASRLSELVMAAEAQDSLKVKRIYVVGSYSRLPGLVKTIQNIFPEAELFTKFQYIQLNEDTELYYSKAIGLALRALFPAEDRKEINLLPHNEKEELIKRMLTPIITKTLFASSCVMAVVILMSGIYMAKAYLGYKVSEKEVEISVQKSDNPYLHQAAQESQQRTQLESQLSTILKDALPIHKIASRIDSYNSDVIGLISVSFSLSSKGNDMRIRAKTNSRPDTEKFISDLGNDAYFTNIVSPLSNLSGKGERFINIDLSADQEGIAAEDIRPKPKKPTVKAGEAEVVNNPVAAPAETPDVDTPAVASEEKKAEAVATPVADVDPAGDAQAVAQPPAENPQPPATVKN